MLKKLFYIIFLIFTVSALANEARVKAVKFCNTTMMSSDKIECISSIALSDYIDLYAVSICVKLNPPMSSDKINVFRV